MKALPASDEDGVGRMRRLGRCAIARGALRGARLQDRRRGVPLDVQSQLDNGQAKYVYPIGVHSGEYLGTLLNRTSASGCGYHFDVLEQPPATRLGKRPHAGSPVAPLPEAPELAGDGERSLRGCLAAGDEIAAALAAAKELLTPQEAVTSRAALERMLACAPFEPPGDVTRTIALVYEKC